MQEQNKQVLQQALSQLPQHTPPAGIWEEIQTALDTDQMLEQQLPALPTYIPPEALWDAIETQLPRIIPAQRRFGKVFMFRLAAAAVLSGMAFGVWWLNSSSAEEALIVQTQEIVDPYILEASMAPEDSAFVFVRKFCESGAPICRDPVFDALRIELDELSEAKNALRDAMGPYNDDLVLAEQMVHLERERSALLQKILQLI
jgi:hypothetical protein